MPNEVYAVKVQSNALCNVSVLSNCQNSVVLNINSNSLVGFEDTKI